MAQFSYREPTPEDLTPSWDEFFTSLALGPMIVSGIDPSPIRSGARYRNMRVSIVHTKVPGEYLVTYLGNV